MNLILVRHGETRENINRIVQGQKYGTLTNNGHEQGKKVALLLKDEHFDLVFSSDLARCKHTAKHILQFHPHLKLKFDKRIREISFGELEGRLGASVDWTKIVKPDGGHVFPGGESNTDLSKRVVEFINWLYKKYPDKVILVVTHGGPMRSIFAGYHEVPFGPTLDTKIENTEVHRYQIDKPIKVPSYL